jgi:hypothetical protein
MTFAFELCQTLSGQLISGAESGRPCWDTMKVSNGVEPGLVQSDELSSGVCQDFANNRQHTCDLHLAAADAFLVVFELERSD